MLGIYFLVISHQIAMKNEKDGMDPNRTVPHPTKLKRLVAILKDLGSLKESRNIKIELGRMRN